jgi:hypothetical protein
MGGTVELKLVYTSKVGTKTEVSKYLPADKTQIEVLTNNHFFKNDPEIAEWARSVIKIESEAYSEEPGPSNAHKGKRAYAYAGTSTSGTGLRYRWETQPRKNGKFTKQNAIAENTGKGFFVHPVRLMGVSEEVRGGVCASVKVALRVCVVFTSSYSVCEAPERTCTSPGDQYRMHS